MLMNGEVIMWVFGLVFVCFTTLTSVIWSQLNRRIEAIEESAREDREQMLHLAERIFDKVDKVENYRREFTVKAPYLGVCVGCFMVPLTMECINEEKVAVSTW